MSGAWCRTCLQIVALFSSLPPAALAQALPEVPPSAIGLSSDGVGALDSLMSWYTARGRFPALMLMVARDGKIGYWKAAGVRDLSRGDALERNDVFRIASITKPITATAILMLWEQGKLQLDDPVDRYVPILSRLRVYEGPGRTRLPARALTIRHLLTFTAGMIFGSLEAGTGVDSALARANLFASASSLDDLMRRLADLPLIGDPGDSLAYGFQTEVLGKVVEVASGMPLDRFFRDQIFGPLRMSETSFRVDASQTRRYPTLYSLTANGPPQLSDAGNESSNFARPLAERREFRYLSGGGGLVSTPADYIRFLQMIANRGELDGVRLLKPSTVDTMTAAHRRDESLRVSSGQGPGWGAAFQWWVGADIKATGGGGHDGLYWMSGGSNLFVWVDPASKVVGMVWAQALPYRVLPLFEDARRLVHSIMKN